MGSRKAPLFLFLFLFAQYPVAAYFLSVEPAPPPQNTPSVSAAGTQKPSASNLKTSGAFGKAKALKRMSDYFPAPFRKAKRQHTFAANCEPKETDALAEYIAKEQGWEKK